MKRWVLLIFCINQTLDARCKNIQKKIEKLALNPYEPCQIIYDRILGLYDLKNDLINLRVLHNAMTRALTIKENEMIQKAAFKNNCSVGHGGDRFRGVNRILKRCERVLAKHGFDKKRFERDYPYLSGTSLLKKG